MVSFVKPLLSPIKLGNIYLRNSIIMSALSRCRADYTTCAPNEMHVKYYSERAKQAGLIISECSSISARGNSFKGECGVWTDEREEGWRKVCNAVHKVDGRIFLQLWHCGSCAISEILRGQKPIGPSNIKNRHPMKTANGFREYDEPVAMTEEDIKEVLNQFRQSVQRAVKANFDGVELHSGNGFLVDSFLRDCINNRTDKYGGSIENRCRFPLEIIDELISILGSDKVGIKITPVSRTNDMYDSDPITLYNYFLNELSKRNIAYIHLLRAPDYRPVNSLYSITGESQIPNVYSTFRKSFNGLIIANDQFTFETGNEILTQGLAEMVSFGRFWIANSDLVDRFKNNWKLNQVDENSYYTPGPKGYLDYPRYL
jgi:N-ethylmaleimide reductase